MVDVGTYDKADDKVGEDHKPTEMMQNLADRLKKLPAEVEIYRAKNSGRLESALSDNCLSVTHGGTLVVAVGDANFLDVEFHAWKEEFAGRLSH